MAKCPRCVLSVAPYTRCDRCGLMLGFEGLTVLLDFEDSASFARARALAERQPSPVVEWFFHSHPAISKRVAAAEAWAKARSVQA